MNCGTCGTPEHINPSEGTVWCLCGVTAKGGQYTLTHPPTPPREPTETEARDDILDALEKWRAKAVRLGRDAAYHLGHGGGHVTATAVKKMLVGQGYGQLLSSIDGRVAGAWFERGKWERIGWESTGSHGRPVAVWRLR